MLLNRLRRLGAGFALAFVLLAGASFAAPAPVLVRPPHLEQRHGAVQLIVHGRPFLILGGELENSSASSSAFLQTVWPKLAAMHFNTVLSPVYWQLIEPREGQFDFRSVDELIAGARAHHLKLVLLWFGSWKNSMSCYVPDWIKENSRRFPRVENSNGRPEEILSALSSNNLRADAAAFAALMRHLRAVDGARQTVLMVQVENEVGMIPEARDHSPAANAAFAARVPRVLTDYLTAHRRQLAPALREVWERNGARTGASWSETFGPGMLTDELFNAWSEARYTGKVAAAGKAVYPLPMYVNAALIAPGRRPGQYPSGGPLPHLYDIWRAAAPRIDMVSPDIYFPNFVCWARKYVRQDNPLFIPESGRADAAHLAADAFYAFGQLDAIGFSVYAPEFFSSQQREALGQAYSVLDQLTPLLLANQGTKRIIAFTAPVDFKGQPDLTPRLQSLEGYGFHASFTRAWPPPSAGHPAPEIAGGHAAVIVRSAPNEFWVAGTGTILTFSVQGEARKNAGIASIWEGRFVNGRWVAGRNLNGDDDNQGRYLSRAADSRFASCGCIYISWFS